MAEFAKIVITVLLCIAAFGFVVVIIVVITQTVGKIIFGQRFEDWWDSKFFF